MLSTYIISYKRGGDHMTSRKSRTSSETAFTQARYNAEEARARNIVGRRIAEARRAGNLSLASLGRLLSEYGVSISAAGISKWEVGGSLPSAYQLLSVCHALGIEDGLSYFSGEELRPLLNGEGMKKVSEYRLDLIASGKYRPQQADGAIRYIEMPVSSLPASAGTGAFLDGDTFDMVSFPEPEVPEDAEFGLQVSGDSMEPVYHDGQIVWVQRCSAVSPGEVGIFIYDGSGYIKVYGEQVPEEGDREAFTDSSGSLHMQPMMISYNKAYDPRPVSPEAEFQVVGRVVR